MILKPKLTFIERQFLKTLEGCTAPIALARYNEKEDNIHFQGFVLTERENRSGQGSAY
jgi:porphobilinogen deaminase